MNFLKHSLFFLLRISFEIGNSLYDSAEKFLADADGIIIFTKDIFKKLPSSYRVRKNIYKEMLYLGYDSVLLVLFSISFLGIIAVLESYYHLTLVITDVSLLPGFIARLLIREGGSTLTALVVICRICPGITSELALKKETEQLDAYKMMGVDVIELLILPKVVATFITLIMLSVLSTFVVLIVAMFTCFTHLNITAQNMWLTIDLFVTGNDFIISFIKVISYGIAIPIIAAYCGLTSGSGATEIGKSSTKSIVHAGVTVITLDLIITWIFRFIE